MYSHEEIYRSLGVGNAGGIRFALNPDNSTMRGVLFTSVPCGRIQSENPYHDRVEDGVLIFTAQGRRGDQGFGGQNQRLLTHAEHLFPIYGFQLIASRRDKSVGQKRWKFLGFLLALRHYKERQIDALGTARTACIFEFSVISDFSHVLVQDDALLAQGLYRDYMSNNQADFSETVTNSAPTQLEDNHADELERIRGGMLLLPPKTFEGLIKVTLERTGLSNVTLTRYTQDGGIDVEALAGEWQWPIRGLHIQIQAKRWIRTVGRREVAELRGSLTGFSHGAFVTTSQFSKSALQEALCPGKTPITLLDGYDFARIIRHYNVPLTNCGS